MRPRSAKRSGNGSFTGRATCHAQLPYASPRPRQLKLVCSSSYRIGRGPMTTGEQKKSWYSARLVFRCDIGNQPVPSDIFEESIRLVRAADEAEASERAAAIGRINERDEQSSVGEMVRWRF